MNSRFLPFISLPSQEEFLKGRDIHRVEILPIPGFGFQAACPTQWQAFWKIFIQGLYSPHPGGCQELDTVLKTRSGCGIMMVNRPSSLVNAVNPKSEWLGL